MANKKQEHTENAIHATAIAYKGKAILIRGKSGSGKSDLALRMIVEKGATLISDDRVIVLQNNRNEIVLYSHPEIKGKIEVRGLGIVNVKYEENIPLGLIVDLEPDLKKIERLPKHQKTNVAGNDFPLLIINPFEVSSVIKLCLAFETLVNER